MQLQAIELPPGAQATVIQVLWAQLVQAKKQSPFCVIKCTRLLLCDVLCSCYDHQQIFFSSYCGYMYPPMFLIDISLPNNSLAQLRR